MSDSQTIWQLFLDKIETDWDLKYSEFGDSIANIKEGKQIALCNAVILDIKENLKAAGVKTKIIDPLVLHGYIQKNGLSSKSKEQTLFMFIQYLGFEDWAMFKKLHGKENIFSEENATKPTVQEEIEGNIKAETIDKKATSKSWYLTGTFVLVSVLTIVFFNYSQRLEFTSSEKALFEKIIDDANNAELGLYKSLPLDSIQFKASNEKLSEYFTEDGTAKKIILGGAIKAMREKRKLRSPPSSYSKVDIFFKAKREKEVKIETNEQWYLLWYDIESNKDRKLFDTLNHHIYILKFVNGKWRIHMDEYRGRPKKLND